MVERSPWNAVQLSTDDHVVSQSVLVVVSVVGVGGQVVDGVMIGQNHHEKNSLSVAVQRTTTLCSPILTIGSVSYIKIYLCYFCFR